MIHVFCLSGIYLSHSPYDSFLRVSEKLQLRITDAALSRDLFPSDYESAGAELARPIKWMAYEVITDRVISTSSDVVSQAAFDSHSGLDEHI